jgi:hypothetical protein
MLLVILVSCNNDKKVTEETTANPQVKTTAQVDPKTQKLESLKTATATDLDQMQKMVPAEMAGIKRTRLNMNSNIGYSIVQADYVKNSKSDIRLIAYDCAGEQGSQLYNSSFLSYLDKNEENAGGYTKTINLNGKKTIEKYEAATKSTSISFLANETVLMVLHGKNISAETLKEAALKL